MKINHCETLGEVLTGPSIEIRDTGDQSYMLQKALLAGEFLMSGPFPPASIAEKVGVAEAERRGVEMLNIVHTAAN